MKGINKYLGTIVMGTALLAVPSCTDTWNEHYDNDCNSYDMARESLWELLESREDLSKFREIAAKAKFYRDENHPAYTINGSDTVYYTFKDVLSANTPVTLWAPVNDAMTEEEWQKYANMVETEGFNLQQQFIGNHMALYRKTMAKTGEETFRLINSKFATLNYTEKTFQDANVTVCDIPARNGLLHVLDSKNEFFFNIYEYIKFSGDVPIFSEYLVKRDTTYFLESASIEGLPDENGNPTYVDSVYFQDNMMFNRSSYNPTGSETTDAWMNSMKMFNAYINTEDSSYVMVIPTDAAWMAAVEKMKPYYNYGEGIYPRMGKVKLTASKGATRGIVGARKTYDVVRFGDRTGTIAYETVDSLQAVNLDMDIIYPLAFNINLQPKKDGKPWTKESFIEQEGFKDCEYLLTTTGDTIRDILDEAGNIVWSKDVLFKRENLKEMSNGYAFITDSWDYHQSYWMRDIDVEASVGSVYDKPSNTIPTNREMNNTTAASWIDQYGRCSEQAYLHVAGRTSNTNPDIAFILQGNKQGSANIMSAKYDVQVTLVPMWYNSSDTAAVIPEIVPKARLVCTLYGWSTDHIGKKDISFKKQEKLGTFTIDYDGTSVQTFTIMEDVAFPLTYKNLDDAYPVLHITSDKLSNGDKRIGYQMSFNIDRIVLKCKEAE